MPVHDALGHARRARRVEDDQRVVEAHLHEVDVAGFVAGDEVFEQHGPGKAAGRRLVARVGNDDGPLETAEFLLDRGNALEGIELLAVVEVSIAREQDLGGDLPETVEQTLDAEVRRARRPDRAQARCRQHGNDGLGHVGHEARHPIAFRDAHGRERLHRSRDLIVHLVEGEFPADPVLTPKNHGGRIVPPP